MSKTKTPTLPKRTRQFFLLSLMLCLLALGTAYAAQAWSYSPSLESQTLFTLSSASVIGVMLFTSAAYILTPIKTALRYRHASKHNTDIQIEEPALASNAVSERSFENAAIDEPPEAHNSQHFEHLREELNTAIALVLPDFTITYMNASCRALMVDEDCLHLNQVSSLRPLLPLNVKLTEMQHGGWVETRGKKRLWLRSKALTARTAQKMYLIEIHDLTELHDKIREEISDAKAMLVDKMACGIAHNFNNLLASIQGNIEIVSQSSALAPAQQDALKSALEAAEHGASLAHDLLSSAGKQKLAIEPVDLSAVIRAETAHLQGIDLDLGTDSDALCDRYFVARIMRSLIDNAIEAVSRTGDVSVSTRVEHIGSNHMLRIDVIDTGVGMDKVMMSNIRDPFYTTKHMGRGRGLGLSVAHGLATQMGGSLEVSSTLGKGTTATLRLPNATSGQKSTLLEYPTTFQHNTEAAQHVLVVGDSRSDEAHHLLHQLDTLNRRVSMTTARKIVTQFGAHCFYKFDFVFFIDNASDTQRSALNALSCFCDETPIVIVTNAPNAERNTQFKTLGIEILADPFTADSLRVVLGLADQFQTQELRDSNVIAFAPKNSMDVQTNTRLI